MVEQPVQRREERREVNWISVIRLADGSDLPCTVKDVSASGLKICVAAEHELPETFMIRVVGRQLVFRVRKAWRRQHFTGVIIEKIAKLPDSVPVPVPEPARAPTRVATEHTRLGSHRRFGASD